MKEIVEKKEVEELLGCEITDEQFEEALKYARHKQEYIYQRERRQVVLQHWYLVKLTEEYVRSLAFQNSLWIYAEHCVIWKKSTRSEIRVPLRITIL